jgi:hypothetical protein
MENNNSSGVEISPNGIPINDLAIQTNTDDLTCIICLNICYKPVMITCCERLICSECVKMMLRQKINKCPHCNNINLNFENPPKIIIRLLDNLTFKCCNLGCEEKIKYSFYYDHIYNSCSLKEGLKEFCKICSKIYNKNTEHKCNYELNLAENDNLNVIEKRLLELDLNCSKNNSTKSVITTDNSMSSKTQQVLPIGTVSIPRLHNHNLILTNQRKKVEYEQGWCCELCSDDIRSPYTKSYHCELCTYDICEKCYLYISVKLPQTNIHSHELNLEIRNAHWSCDKCKNDYYNRRSWFCDLCDYDICVFCYWK